MARGGFLFSEAVRWRWIACENDKFFGWLRIDTLTMYVARHSAAAEHYLNTVRREREYILFLLSTIVLVGETI